MHITLYDVIYNVRYYPRISVTALGLGTYYPQIRRSTRRSISCNKACYDATLYSPHSKFNWLLVGSRLYRRTV